MPLPELAVDGTECEKVSSSARVLNSAPPSSLVIVRMSEWPALTWSCPAAPAATGAGGAAGAVGPSASGALATARAAPAESVVS